jgi:hypothetical protein
LGKPPESAKPPQLTKPPEPAKPPQLPKPPESAKQPQLAKLPQLAELVFISFGYIILFFPLLRILISFIDFYNLCNKNKETVVHEQLNCV